MRRQSPNADFVRLAPCLAAVVRLALERLPIAALVLVANLYHQRSVLGLDAVQLVVVLERVPLARGDRRKVFPVLPVVVGVPDADAMARGDRLRAGGLLLFEELGTLFGKQLDPGIDNPPRFGLERPVVGVDREPAARLPVDAVVGGAEQPAAQLADTLCLADAIAGLPPAGVLLLGHSLLSLGAALLLGPEEKQVVIGVGERRDQDRPLVGHEDPGVPVVHGTVVDRLRPGPGLALIAGTEHIDPPERTDMRLAAAGGDDDQLVVFGHPDRRPAVVDVGGLGDGLHREDLKRRGLGAASRTREKTGAEKRRRAFEQITAGKHYFSTHRAIFTIALAPAAGVSYQTLTSEPSDNWTVDG